MQIGETGRKGAHDDPRAGRSDHLSGHGRRPAGSARPTRARPALPSGRALVGGLLVAASMVGAFAVSSASRSGPDRKIVVARRAISVGQRITADDVRLEPAGLAERVAGHLFDGPGGVIDSVALVPLARDSLIVRSAVVADGGAGQGQRQFSFPVDRERAVNATLRPGERVDVLVTYGTGDGARTFVVATGIRLSGISEAGGSAMGSNGKVVVTVELSDHAQLLRAAHASEVGAVTLVRSTGAEPIAAIDPYLTPVAGTRPESNTATRAPRP